MFSKAVVILATMVPLQASNPMLQILSEINQPENKINLARGILLIDQLIDPNINPEKYKNKLDQLNLEIENYHQDSKGPNKLTNIRKVLYNPKSQSMKYSYHHVSQVPPPTKRIQQSLLSYYLKTQLGTCISMPLLILILAEDQPHQLQLSVLNDHWALTFKHRSDIYFEATSNQMLPITKWANASKNEVPKALKKSEILLAYLQLYGAHLVYNDQLMKARSLFRYLVKKSNGDPTMRQNLKAIYARLYIKTKQEAFRQLLNHY
ncbi:MAG: hypothetical protein VW397_02265 [Candidatus Margulisiibacteriota bacterium]